MPPGIWKQKGKEEKRGGCRECGKRGTEQEQQQYGHARCNPVLVWWLLQTADLLVKVHRVLGPTTTRGGGGWTIGDPQKRIDCIFVKRPQTMVMELKCSSCAQM